MSKKIALSSLFVSLSLFAQTPTPEQMAQFKQLPKAQQEQLAKQYGIPMSVINGTGGGASQAPTQTTIQGPQKTVSSTGPVVDIKRQLDGLALQVKELNKELGLDEGELKPFGYEVLKGTPESFTLSDDFPVPNDYLIGPGDELKIELYGKVNQEFILKVTREGMVNLPTLGPINASGLTFSEFRALMTKTVKNKIIGVDATISMGSMRMMQVYIVGESVQPGAYNVAGITTITQAIIASGGIKETGSLRNIQLKRKGKVVKTLDMYDLLLKGDTKNDIRLERGDTLFIPTVKEVVSVEGAIKRPAIYELKKRTKLVELLKNAGGTDVTAFLQRVSIQRITEEGVVVETVDLNSKKGKNFIVKSGDKIQIPKVRDSFSSGIAIRGEVARQGVYQFKKGMKVTDLLSSTSTDLKVTTDLNYALVVREINTHRDIKVFQFDLANAIDSPESKDNLVLQDRDQLFVFSNDVDAEFWLGIKDETESTRTEQNKLKLEEESLQRDLMQASSTIEVVDGQTGAVLKTDSAKKEDVPLTAGQLGKAERLNLREDQLKPILDRLKAQASLLSPAEIVDIAGDVKYPGRYPLTENADVNSLIKAGGGLLESAFTNRAELSRTTYKDTELIIKQTNILLETKNAENGGLVLKAKDRLNILSKPGWNDELILDLQGEVMFPGKYTFKRGTTISEIITRAGGLTKFADENGAIFAREKLKKREIVQMNFLRAQLQQQIAGMTLRKNSSSASFSSTPTDAMALVNELETTEPMGRMVINLPEILKGNDKFDIVLANEDKLYIPEQSDSISIVGEVQYTSSHTFTNDKMIDDYINLAGGMKAQADSDRVYVVRADGSVLVPNNSFWFSRENEALRAGDTIIVPIDVDYLDGLSTIASATQIVYQLGVAWSAINGN
ncbi:sugar transporter [Psychromonas sp. Urea-02u-13]|nr:sugar transporter [Psychromonas sp. Urea-02u-13]